MTETTGAEVSGEQENVRADRVEIRQGNAASVEAETVTVEQGGVGRVQSQDLSVSMGGVGLARTEKLNLGQGSSAFVVATDDAEVAEGSNVFMLLARNASGNVRPVLDWRAAAAFGVGLGLALRLLRRGRRAPATED